MKTTKNLLTLENTLAAHGARALVALLVGAATLAAAPEDADAQQRRRQHPHHRPAAHSDMDLVFQDIQVTYVDGAWGIDYSVESNSWTSVERAGIAPSIDVFIPGQSNFRQSSRLNGRRGRIVYPASVSFDQVTTIEISVAGRRGDHRITRTTYADQCAGRVRVPIAHRGPRHHRDHDRRHPVHHPVHHPPQETIIVHHPPHHAPHHPHHPHHPPVADSGRAQVVAACKSQTRFSSDFDMCLERALRLPSFEAAPIVHACGAASSHGSGLRTCLDGSMRLSGDRADTIRACGEVSKFDSDLRECLDQSARYQTTASAVVRTCGQVTKFSSELRGCIANAAALPIHQAPATISACGQHTSFNSGFNQCLTTAATLGHDRVQLIHACGQSSRFDSDLNQCMARLGRSGAVVVEEHHHHYHPPVVAPVTRPTTHTRTTREVGRTITPR